MRKSVFRSPSCFTRQLKLLRRMGKGRRFKSLRVSSLKTRFASYQTLWISLQRTWTKTTLSLFEKGLERTGSCFTRKQIFPYRFLNSLERLGYEELVPREEFGSWLGEGEVFEGNEAKGVEVRPISEEDYEHYKMVMSKFGCRTFGDYLRLYFTSDVDLLSIIFEKFIDSSMLDFGIDPSHSYTAAGFFWEAMLKFTGVKLELLTDPQLYKFFERSIRAGVSMGSCRLAKANKYMKNYDETKENSYIVDLDANGLYASNMSDPLLVGSFKWLTEKSWRKLAKGL